MTTLCILSLDAAGALSLARIGISTHARTSMSRLVGAKGLGGLPNQTHKAAYKGGRSR